MEQLDVTVLRSAAGRQVRVLVAGELDLTSTGLLRSRLDTVLAGTPDHVQIDLSGVTFLSCAAARMLAEVSRCATAAVRVAAIRPPARKLLETMRLQVLLDQATTIG